MFGLLRPRLCHGAKIRWVYLSITVGGRNNAMTSKRPIFVYAEIGIKKFMPSSGLCRASPRNIAKSQNLSVAARHNPESLSTVTNKGKETYENQIQCCIGRPNDLSNRSFGRSRGCLRRSVRTIRIHCRAWTYQAPPVTRLQPVASEEAHRGESYKRASGRALPVAPTE